MSKEEGEPERTADNGLHSDCSDDSDASDKDSDKLPRCRRRWLTSEDTLLQLKRRLTLSSLPKQRLELSSLQKQRLKLSNQLTKLKRRLKLCSRLFKKLASLS
jgi:hypothetical protein